MNQIVSAQRMVRRLRAIQNTPRKKVLLTVLLLLALAPAVQAQINSAPPLLQGQPSYHLWTVAGVINNGEATVIMCGNTSSQNVIVGVEVFDAAGASRNNASTTSLTVPPSGSVM